MRERLHDWVLCTVAAVYSDWPQRPFSLLRLLPDTPHRGIANGEPYERLMFFATIDSELCTINETAFFRYSSTCYESIS